MPTFPPLPPSLRPPVRSPQPDPRAIHIPLARATVNCGVYVDGERLKGKFTHEAALAKVHELSTEGKAAFVWIGLHEPDDHQMQVVAEVFGLHPLAAEDAVQAHQRPKLDRYDEMAFMVLKTVKYVEHESMAKAREIVETGEIMVFVGPHFVVTVRHGEHTELVHVREEMDESPERLCLGPYAVLHAIADHVVDTYLDVALSVEDDIDLMEEHVFSPGRSTQIEQIYLLKREIVELRRSVTPLTLPLQRLTEDERLAKEIRRYFRDVLDHNVRASEQIASYDEMLSSLVQGALGKVTMQQNTDMRKISAWVAIAAVPTMVAGIYGMNFDHMPELRWEWGYYMVLALMLIICGSLYITFRRNHWL